jgi:hypothetical protein
MCQRPAYCGRGIVPVLPSAVKSDPRASNLRPGPDHQTDFDERRRLGSSGFLCLPPPPAGPLRPACAIIALARARARARRRGRGKFRHGPELRLKARFGDRFAAWGPGPFGQGPRPRVAGQRPQAGRACGAQPGGTGTAPAGAETMAKRQPARSMDGPGCQLTRRGGRLMMAPLLVSTTSAH